MNDPLAALLAEMQDLSVGTTNAEHARWLRVNRDRVTLLLYADDRDAALRAFGGKPDTIVSDFVSDRKWAEWLFPYGEDQ